MAGPTPWSRGEEPWVELRATHSGAVLLLGDLAVKLKLPVTLGFLDFSTHEARVEACRRELDLNRRIAPDVYRGLGWLDAGTGTESAEPLVVMRRLPGRARLRSMVEHGVDVTDQVTRLARLLAGFHAAAGRSPQVEQAGTRDAIAGRWEDSFAQVRAAAHPGLDDRVLDEIERLTRRFLAGRSALFDERVSGGYVVEGHGDLLAEDIFCLPDGPRVLDCLDFDLGLRSLDQLDDVCCLAMDLERLGAPEQARRLVEAYVEHTADPAPASLVHHFVAYRAFVRAKVGCLRGAAEGRGEVARHAQLCRDHLRAGTVRLVLVGGPPGTGKSTLAGAIADAAGYVVLDSDRVRKELAGLDPESPARSAYATGIYREPHTRATYDELLRRAALLLGRGESVVIDATWRDPAQRAAAEHLAERASADLVRFRCTLPLDLVERRIRSRTGPSDADATIAARLAQEWPAWPDAHTVDTRPPPARCRDEALSILARPACATTGERRPDAGEVRRHATRRTP